MGEVLKNSCEVKNGSAPHYLVELDSSCALNSLILEMDVFEVRGFRAFKLVCACTRPIYPGFIL